MEDEGKKYWLSIAAFVLVFIAVVVTLSTFMQQTSNRIVAQANQYVSDATAQSCVLVSTLMENTQKDIETIAALASESADVTDIVTSEEWLISVEETSPFDTIDFVDVDGMQHSPQHEPVNVSDRSYFKRAMAGESGIEAVFNTRMTHENLVYFFAPVREGADGPVVGLLLAHYSENRLADLLSGDFFGYASQVMLCLPTGEVVAATDSSYVGRNLIQEAQADPSATSGARDLERAFANHETVTYSYQAERGTGSVCLREVPGLGWMMLETFPAAATEQMINEANEGGWNALFVIVVVFVLVIAGIIFYNNRRHRSLTRSMRDREDVQRGVAKLTERLVLMDLDADRFRYMSGPVTPSDPYELEGPYTAMIERLQGLVVGDEAKAEVAKLYDKHTIIDLMPPGSDEIRFEYQMNRGGDVKWEDINLICVQRDAAGMPTRLSLHNPGRHGAQAAREAAPAGHGGLLSRGGCRQQRQERLPLAHEPRYPHADERHHRHDGARAHERGASGESGRLPGEDHAVEQPFARADQRGSRSLHDRERAPGAYRGRGGSASVGSRDGDDVLAALRRIGHRLRD